MAACSIKVQPASEEESARLRLLYDAIDKYGLCPANTNPGRCSLPITYDKHKENIKNFALKPDDIWLLTYPKCGTTWMTHLVALLKSDFDFEKMSKVSWPHIAHLDFPFLFDVLKKDGVPIDRIFAAMLEHQHAPRLLGSHLPFCLLPESLFEKCKVIICIRNPMDTVVSKYHFEKLLKAAGFVGDFSAYFDLFMDGLDNYGSYFEYVKLAWEKRHHPNVCMLFFEEIKKDISSVLRKVARFLGKNFTDEQIKKSAEFLSFKQMKQRGSNKEMDALLNKEDIAGSIMRKGEIGDWKNYFTEEMKKRMDETVEKHFKPIGLEFQYD